MSGVQTDKTSSLLTVFKEVVSAVLGMAIIAAVLYLLWTPLTKSPPDLTSAQGIFTILGGWGGVILGYYFGRLPSEKAADNARRDADNARKEKDKAVNTKILVLANSNNLLDNHEKSLQQKKEALQALPQQPATRATVDSAIKTIEEEIEAIGKERQKLQDMAK